MEIFGEMNIYEIHMSDNLTYFTRWRCGSECWSETDFGTNTRHHPSSKHARFTQNADLLRVKGDCCCDSCNSPWPEITNTVWASQFHYDFIDLKQLDLTRAALPSQPLRLKYQGLSPRSYHHDYLKSVQRNEALGPAWIQVFSAEINKTDN